MALNKKAQKPLSSYFRLKSGTSPTSNKVVGQSNCSDVTQTRDEELSPLVHVQQGTIDDEMWDLHPEFVLNRTYPVSTAASIDDSEWKSLSHSNNRITVVEKEDQHQCVKNTFVLTDVLDELQNKCPSFNVQQIFDRYFGLTTNRESSDKVGLWCSIPVIKDHDRHRLMVNHSALPSKSVFMYNLPWTQVYSPTQANHLIGNSKSSSALLQWLNQWKSKCGHTTNKDGAKGVNWLNKEWKDNDPDFFEEEEFPLVALVYGPHGTGKTAAVYACAHEMGFKVCEVNASSLRNRSQLLHKLKEATLSHRMQPFMSRAGLLDNPSANTLILLEEVDVIFQEDHGFLQGIQDIISSTKRPIILTCSGIQNTIMIKSKVMMSYHHHHRVNLLPSQSVCIYYVLLVLPSDPSVNLQVNFLELQFCFPSELELSLHLSLLSLANGFPLSLHHSHQISQFFHSDIRRAVLYMQFMLSWQPVDPIVPLISESSVQNANTNHDYTFSKQSYCPWRDNFYPDTVMLHHSELDLISILNDFKGEIDYMQGRPKHEPWTSTVQPSLIDELADDSFVSCSVGQDIFDILSHFSCIPSTARSNDNSTSSVRITAQQNVLDKLFSSHWKLSRMDAFTYGLPFVHLMHNLDNLQKSMKEGRRQTRCYFQSFIADLDIALLDFK